MSAKYKDIIFLIKDNLPALFSWKILTNNMCIFVMHYTLTVLALEVQGKDYKFLNTYFSPTLLFQLHFA